MAFGYRFARRRCGAPAGPATNSCRDQAGCAFELVQQHLVVTKGAIGLVAGLNLLIDTGTIPSVVDARLARKLHLQAVQSTLVAFGQQVPVESAVIEGFQIGGLRTGPVPAMVGDLSY